MSAPTWQALRDAIEKMVAYPAGDGWHISREAADKALEWIKWAEVHQPYPVPKLLPEEDEDLSLVWRSVDGWAIYRTFPKGEEPYWLAMPSRTPAALSASPEVQALIAAAETRVIVDPVAIEADGKRWHGEDHRVVAVRWEPYRPDGARQMKAKGRWQEMVGSGDYWRWQNCERPAALRALKKGE